MNVYALYDNGYFKGEYLKMIAELTILRNEVDDMKTDLKFSSEMDADCTQIPSRLPPLIDKLDAFLLDNAKLFFLANAGMAEALATYSSMRNVQMQVDSTNLDEECTKYFQMISYFKRMCEFVKDWVSSNDQLPFKIAIMLVNACIYWQTHNVANQFMEIENHLNSTNLTLW